MKQLLPERHYPALLLCATLAVILLGGLYHALFSSTRLATDQAGYFSWGYTFLVHGTLDPGPDLRQWSPEAFPEVPLNGQTLTPNKFPIGWSLATLPFMAVARALAAFQGLPATDPNTFDLLVRSSRIGVLFWVTLGILCAYAALALLTSRLSAAGALLLTFLGTSAFAYTWRDTGMSHAISLSFICITYFTALRCVFSPRPWPWALLLGAAAGMVLCTRFLNLLLILPAFFLLFFQPAPVPAPALMGPLALLPSPRLPRTLRLLLLAALAAAPFLLLQAALWKYLYGAWFFNGYAGEGFAPNLPNQFRLLFSSRHGLFFWHPILLISMCGLLVAFRNSFQTSRASRLLLLSIAASLLAITLLYGAWSSWSLGWSFGARWAADAFFLWALGISLFGQHYLPGGNFPRFSLLLLPALWSASLQIGQFAGLLPRDATLHLGHFQLP